MKLLPISFLALSALLGSDGVFAKKPTRPRSVAASSSSRRPPAKTKQRPSGGSRNAPPPRRRPVYDEEEEDDVIDEYDAEIVDPIEEEIPFEEDFEEEEEEEFVRPTKSRKSSSRKPQPQPSRGRAPTSSSRKRPPPRYEEDEYDDDYPPSRVHPSRSRRGGPPPPRGRHHGGRVVPYAKPGAAQNAAATFTRGWEAVKNVMPDPSSVREAAMSGISTAKQTTSNLSSNLYREIKGLTSSELEQVMLKATRPDDTPVKGKHAERLVGVTYQISSRYDIYDAVLRKLWKKMAEKDWRTTVKALYILHRFSADGAPEHAPALKARLRELRRTPDPKGKDKYFNSKQLLAGDTNPDTVKFRAFMARYAHYVLLRAQMFSGLFEEIASPPKIDKKKPSPVKPITATQLRSEHLNAAELLLKSGVVCLLKDGEECENTAIACERVAADMIGLTSAVAMALNRALKDNDLKGADPALLKKWCVFYKQELLPQTKSMVKKASPKLDAYGLFLPSRMGTSVTPAILERGMHLDEEEVEEEVDEAETSQPVDEVVVGKEAVDDEEVVVERPTTKSKQSSSEPENSIAEEEEAVEEEAEFDDEYEYEEEEYYDDEEE